MTSKIQSTNCGWDGLWYGDSSVRRAAIKTLCEYQELKADFDTYKCFFLRRDQNCSDEFRGFMHAIWHQYNNGMVTNIMRLFPAGADTSILLDELHRIMMTNLTDLAAGCARTTAATKSEHLQRRTGGGYGMAPSSALKSNVQRYAKYVSAMENHTNGWYLNDERLLELLSFGWRDGILEYSPHKEATWSLLKGLTHTMYGVTFEELN